MGKWLTRNQLLLGTHGVEVFRPPRASKKRLWDWRKIIRDDDTYDAQDGKVSSEASTSISNYSKGNQQNDTCTSEELAILLPKEALS